MSLYIKLQIGFWTHRKTIRLRALLGDDAYWIVPRLWSYAAEHQPDGDFSSYSKDELALLLGYNKDASSMLQALQQAGFMEEMRLHAWEEHNGYHATYSERAKKGAAARWGKKKSLPQTPSKENTDKDNDNETSIASSMLEASVTCEQVVEEWNKLPKIFPKVRELSAERRKSLRARLKSPFWLENWQEALRIIPTVPFFRGETKGRDWIISFEFFIRPDSVARIIEGEFARDKEPAAIERKTYEVVPNNLTLENWINITPQ